MKHSHYYKDVSKLQRLDIYRLIELYEVTDPGLQHILKKALCAGKRGAKDFRTDLENIRDTAVRRLEMLDEDAGTAQSTTLEDGSVLTASAPTGWNQSPCVICGETEDRHYNGRCGSVTGHTGYTPTDQHAELKKQWKPGQRWQVRCIPRGFTEWVQAYPPLEWYADHEYRLEPDDHYANTEESKAVISPDTRTPAEKQLDEMIQADIENSGYDLHSVNEVRVLRSVAMRLIEKLNAENPWYPRSTGPWFELTQPVKGRPSLLEDDDLCCVLYKQEREAKVWCMAPMVASDIDWAGNGWGGIVAYKVVQK